MKKTAWLLAALMCIPGLHIGAQEANGENEFTISTQIRPRAEYRNGVLSPRDEGQLPAGFINNRARISMEYRRSDLSMKLSAQHVGVWGQDPQIDKNGRFILNEAWARMDFGNGFFGQLGRQALVYDDERILGGLDWNVAGRFHDAFKLGYENGNHKLHAILAFNQNDETKIGGTFYASGAQPYKTMQTVWYNIKPVDRFNASFMFMNLGREAGVIEDAKTRYMQTMGTYLTYSPSNWNINGTFYYQSGKAVTGQSVSAYMASARVQYTFNNQWSLTVATDYLSGDKLDMDGGSKVKAFDPLYGTHHKFYGSMDYFYASGWETDFNPGLWDNQIGIGFKPTPTVGLSLNYHYFLTAIDVKDYNDMKRGLGSEVDLQIDWTIKKDIRLSAGYSTMFGTETMDAFKGGNHKSWQDWGWLSLNINPKVLFVKW